MSNIKVSFSVGRVCQVCGKGVTVGNNVSHANNRTKRRFKPNLKSVRLLVGNKYKKFRLCTTCLRGERAKVKVKELAKKTTALIEKAKKGQEHFSIV